MITDAFLSLSSAQAVTASAVSTNAIDTSLIGRDIGDGKDLYAHFTVDVSAVAAGAATVQFQIITSASPAMTSPVVLASTDAIGKAELTAGRRPISLQIPIHRIAPSDRYLAAQYVVATGPLASGTFTAVISESRADAGKLYARGFSIV